MFSNIIWITLILWYYAMYFQNIFLLVYKSDRSHKTLLDIFLALSGASAKAKAPSCFSADAPNWKKVILSLKFHSTNWNQKSSLTSWLALHIGDLASLIWLLAAVTTASFPTAPFLRLHVFLCRSTLSLQWNMHSLYLANIRNLHQS